MTTSNFHPNLEAESAIVPTKEIERPLVSFIIPAFNEERHIGACLESIQKLEIPAWMRGAETIVVDNSSTDRTSEISRTLGAKLVTVRPGHPSIARNAGAAAANGDWLAFVDADCVLATDWIAACGSHLVGDTRVVATASVAAAPDERATWVERTWHELSYDPGARVTARVGWLPTFNLLVRRSAFDRAGGFDDALPTCEDCDLGYKLASFGHLIVDRRTYAVHCGASQSLGELFRREAWRSRGNFQLALRRPFDVSNWLSLLLPPCLVFGFACTVVTIIACLLWHWPVWPWLGALGAIAVAVIFLNCRKSNPDGLLSACRRIVVFSTYLAGRTAGLVWPFQRVSR
jgi:glycosyltransferase involved in cell wall biosynthesis